AGGRFAWTTLLLREALVAEAFVVTVFLLTVFLPAALFGAVEDPVDATLATSAFLLVLPVFLTTAASFFAGIVLSPALPAFGQSRSYTRRYSGPHGDRVTALAPPKPFAPQRAGAGDGRGHDQEVHHRHQGGQRCGSAKTEAAADVVAQHAPL